MAAIQGSFLMFDYKSIPGIVLHVIILVYSLYK